MKDELQAQVDILARLVAGIGMSSSPLHDKKEEDVVTRYPTVGWGRGMGEVVDGSDGWLPAIREDKFWPRRTLEYVFFFSSC